MKSAGRRGFGAAPTRRAATGTTRTNPQALLLEGVERSSDRLAPDDAANPTSRGRAIQHRRLRGGC